MRLRRGARRPRGVSPRRREPGLTLDSPPPIQYICLRRSRTGARAMPIHDWTRVDSGLFHAFHQDWISTLSRALNAGILPPDFFAIREQSIEQGIHKAI